VSELFKREALRRLMDGLENHGLTEYGSEIPTELVHKLLDMVVPTVATKAVFDKFSILELGAIDYCRNVLISKGKYIQKTKTGYRILSPGENREQVDNYIGSADKKLSRALKLSRNTPAEYQINDQTEARIVMKSSGSRRSYFQRSD